MAWYEDIEDEIIVRESYAEYSTTISTFEDMVLDLECEALIYSEKNGFQPCLKRKEVIDMYFTPSGTKVYTKTVINKQNVEWILNYIQQQLVHYRMFATQRDISGYLHSISMAYTAADMQRVDVSIQVSESLQHRLKQSA